ncbi:MAG: hypothetical protein ACYTBJ_07960, partial [Planctomycetota bacterium]
TVTYQGGKDEFTLESGQSSNPMVNAFELVRVKSAPRATNPNPPNGAKYVPLNTKLSWDPGPEGTAYNLLIGDIDAKASPEITGLTKPEYDPGPLRKDYRYTWRIEYVMPDGRKSRSDKLEFCTEGRVMLKVDLALPMADGVPYPGTAKEGWAIWADPAWYDMYADGVVTLKNIDSSGIDARLTLGYEGMGCLKVKGMRMHSKKGEGPPTGLPSADPICNTWYQSADWASYGGCKYYPSGYILLAFYNLPAGTYDLYSYHNHWYYCDRYECDCLGLVEYRGEYRASKVEQGPMPSVKAMSFAAAKRFVDEREIYREKHFLDSWNKLSRPVGGATEGVTSIKEVFSFEAQHVEHDEELIPSVISFKTDGSAVLVMYEAPQDYWDYRDYPGGRAILNAFRLEQVPDSAK